MSMERSHSELIKALIQKFIQVTLDDGSVHAGYIGNPEDFQGETMPAQMVLINGLLRVAKLGVLWNPCIIRT